MYRTQWVILYKQKIRDNQNRIIIFTREFWKVTCWSKKTIQSDIGSIASILIDRKNGMNMLHSIETISSLESIFSTYDEIITFLSVITSLYTLLPESMEHRSIYDDMIRSIEVFTRTIWDHSHTEEVRVWIIQFFILLHIRILKKLWFLRDELFHISDVLRYIYIQIDIKNIHQISLGKNLPDHCLGKLREIIVHTLHSFHYWT